MVFNLRLSTSVSQVKRNASSPDLHSFQRTDGVIRRNYLVLIPPSLHNILVPKACNEARSGLEEIEGERRGIRPLALTMNEEGLLHRFALALSLSIAPASRGT